MSIFLLLVCIQFVADPIDPGLGTDDFLQYDDGTAEWLSFEGDYRGTWFHLDDFYADESISRFVLNYAEIWFFHVYALPWDTSDFIAEITDGPPQTPGDVFAHQNSTALHMSPTMVYPFAPCTTSTDFTVTELVLSSSGAPSVASDVSPSTVDRSFSVETPGVIDIWQFDFLIRVNGYPAPPVELTRTSWASVKAIFYWEQLTR